MFALGRFLRWAGRRGWVYNKYNPRPSHAGSLCTFKRFYQPSIEYVIEFEVSDRTDAVQDEAGEPPEEPGIDES